MVLESTMICIDNSNYMRNGDFLPTRFHAQLDAVNFICRAKARSNPENDVGLLTLANIEVLSTLTSDICRIISKLHKVQIDGHIDLHRGIRVATLALKHRQDKSHKMKIVAFVGSPINCTEELFLKLAKQLKKEKINLDIINFGNEDNDNYCLLTSLINNINGKDGNGSHLINIPCGPHLTDQLVIIIQDENLPGHSGYEVDNNSEEDPELAFALRISMEEEQQRQEAEARKHKETEKQDSLLNEQTSLDYLNMTEEEQIAYAIHMSIEETKMKEENEDNDNKDNY